MTDYRYDLSVVSSGAALRPSYRWTQLPSLSKRNMPAKFHGTSPGKAALANCQTGSADEPFTCTLAMRCEPGWLTGTPFPVQNAGIFSDGSSWPPNSSEGYSSNSTYEPYIWFHAASCLYTFAVEPQREATFTITTGLPLRLDRSSVL
eukprot:CAMPEP_0181222022 /NCGR_PEP_ID=MMETSP1096-20121128/29728_1 /TAXON_ID=156174 ORGANISM="Chrysochromulina ericina, Strain CCMP281" /NCGR_SAMPLE_ID=MMETSP1096 /ASSEMBLY_ACC=CAM_ASM_000453 /LENGTH=147 /DNA_ID=CAMNT_0023314723 /DNA_START=246 /DNA_END=686 /DNA_ORIENTATION=-